MVVQVGQWLRRRFDTSRKLGLSSWHEDFAVGAASHAHETSDHGGKFTLMDGDRRLGELTYRARGDERVINHTWVDPQARGKGAAGKLMEAIVASARDQGWKLSATCSYAQWSFDKHPDWGDITGG